MAARIEGTLVRTEDTGVGIRDQLGVLVQVLWPNGYFARDDGERLAVLDGAGNTVAHEGDHVVMAGGFVDAGQPATWLACRGTTIIAP